MKYMIMLYASQQQYDLMAGKATDQPAWSQEVLAGYTIVECESFDRATEIAARITKSPNPGDVTGAYVDVRPIDDSVGDLEV